MLSYEIAKQLKDAGFPQPTDDYGGQYIDAKGEWTGYMNEGSVYSPSLEELIEACGHRYFTMEEQSGEKSSLPEGRQWYAKKRDVQKEAFGSTPIEAIAKLWLVRNKKV